MIKRLILLGLLAALITAINNCGGGGGGAGSLLDKISSNSLTVTTKSQDSGQILPNTALILYEAGKEASKIVAQSNESGVYTFSNLKMGTYVIKAIKVGYNETQVNVVITDGPQRVTVALTESFAPDSISGIVRDISTGNPIPDATVKIKDAPYIFGTTNENGQFVLKGVQPGIYTLETTHIEYKSKDTPNVTKVANVPLTNIEIKLTRADTGTLLLPGTIRGIVFDKTLSDASNNNFYIVEGAIIKLMGSDKPDQSSRVITGYYEFTQVEAKTQYQIIVEKEGYYRYVENVELTLSEEIKTLNIPLTPITPGQRPTVCTIVGIVAEDLIPGAAGSPIKPIQGATVYLAGANLYSITDANGAFSITNISPDVEFSLFAYKDGYYPSTPRVFSIPANRPTKVLEEPIKLQKAAQVIDYNHCSVLGQIVDSTQTPIQGAKVELVEKNLSTLTDSNGFFNFSNVEIAPGLQVSGIPEEQVRMSVSKSGYTGKYVAVALKGGQTVWTGTTVLDKLVAQISGTVVDQNGAPLSDVLVTVLDSSVQSVKTATGTGLYQIQNIPLGTYNILFTKTGYGSVTRNGIVLSTGGQSYTLNVTMSTIRGQLSGYIYEEMSTASDGYQAGLDTPLPNIKVWISNQGASEAIRTTQSAQDGSYSLIDLSPGIYTLHINSGDSINPSYESRDIPITIAEGSQTADYALVKAIGRISGKVYEDKNENATDDGEPALSGITVTVTSTSGTQTAITDSLGNFIFTSLQPGTWTIKTAETDARFRTNQVVIELNRGQSISGLSIGLVRKKGNVVGKIILDGEGTASVDLTKVTVTVLGLSGYTTNPDRTGVYVMNNLPFASASTIYTFQANGEAEGLNVGSATMTSPLQENITVSVPDIRLSKLSRMVFGTVVDSVTGAGIPATIVITELNKGATATSSGSYTFSSIPIRASSPYTFTFRATGYRETNQQFTVPLGTLPLQLPPVSMVSTRGVISGRVVETQTGQPLKSTLITGGTWAAIVGSTKDSCEVGIDGSFSITGVNEGGPYTIKIYDKSSNPKNFPDTYTSASVLGGSTTNVGTVLVTLKSATLSGDVTNALVSGSVIDGATVQIYQPDVGYSATTTTDATGHYFIRVPAYSNYTITVSKTGFSSSSVYGFPVPVAGAKKDFALTPTYGRITGKIYLDVNENGIYDGGEPRIFEAESGAYSNLVLTVYYTYQGRTFTTNVNPDSSYTLTAVPLGSYYVTVTQATGTTVLNTTTWSDPSNPSNRLVIVEASGTTPASVDIAMKKTAVVTTTIIGTVRDERTLSGIQGATVEVVGNTTALTDSNGSYTISNLPGSAEVEIRVTKRGYQWDNTNSRRIVKLTGGTMTMADFVLRPGYGKIVGYVRDASSGSAIGDARITLLGSDLLPINSDPTTGYYEFQSGGQANVPVGTYDMRIVRSGYATVTISGITISYHNQIVHQDINLSRQAGNVEGVVYEDLNGISGYQAGADRPLSGITVTLDPTSSSPLSYTAASDGKYYFLDVSAGTHLLRATHSASGYYQRDVSITITEGTTLIQNIELFPTTGKITGLIYLDSNRNGVNDGETPLAGIQGQYQSGGTSGNFTSNADGTFTIDNLSPGVYTIIVPQGNPSQDAKYVTTSIYVTVFSGQTSSGHQIGLILKTGALTGRVRDASSDNVLEGVTVSLEEYDSFTTTTNSLGRFTFTNVPVGQVTIRYDGYSIGYSIDTKSVTINADATTVAADSRLSKLTRNILGKVVDADTGDPVKDASVEIKILNRSTTTAIDGTFFLTGIPVSPTSPYTLTVADRKHQVPHFAETTRDFLLPVGSTTYILTPDIQVQTKVGKITGRAIDTLTNSPHFITNTIEPHAWLDMTNSNYEVALDSQGYFTIHNVPEGGPYTLTIYNYNAQQNSRSPGMGLGFTEVRTTVTVTAGNTTNVGTLYYTLKTYPVTARVPTSPMVADGKLGSSYALPGVTITASWKGGPFTVTTTTDAGGNYSLFLPPLEFSIMGTKPGYQSNGLGFVSVVLRTGAQVDQFSMSPLTQEIYGSVYLDANMNGIVDPGEEPIFAANGGAYQNTTITVRYQYRGVQYTADVRSNSTFTLQAVPYGSYVITAAESGATNPLFIPSNWRDPANPTDDLVDVSESGVNPSEVKIALMPSEANYGTISGYVQDYKLLHGPFQAPNSSPKKDYVEVAGATIRASTGSYVATTTSDSDGYFFMRLPANSAGINYNFRVTAPNYEDYETGPIAITSPTSSVPNTKVVTFELRPRTGQISGTIYYDNDLQPGVGGPPVVHAPTDYDGLPQPSIEYPLNGVKGHPTIISDWSEAVMSVQYTYRGLTFGTTYYDQTNSTYVIENVPVGEYYLYLHDLTATVISDPYLRYPAFWPRVYTLDGKRPAKVRVVEGQTTENVNFATYVRGGHILGSLVIEAPSSFDPDNTKYTGSLVIPDADLNPPPPNHDTSCSAYLLEPGIYDQYFVYGPNGRGAGKDLFYFCSYPTVNTLYPAGAPAPNDPHLIIPPGVYTLVVTGQAIISTDTRPGMFNHYGNFTRWAAVRVVSGKTTFGPFDITGGQTEPFEPLDY